MKAKRFETGKTYEGTGEVKGISFTVLKRSGNKCVFRRSDGYYEVIDVLWRNFQERIINGKFARFGDFEYYPTGDSWNGKCVKTYERALEIYETTTD